MAAGDGLVTMTPTSIVVAGAGSSASINADGGVDFTSATSLSLNGVFTSSFDNYLIVQSGTLSSDGSIGIRLRASGSDDSGNNYIRQFLNADGATVGASRGTATNIAYIFPTSAANMSGNYGHFYGPYLAQPTAIRSVTNQGLSGGRMFEAAVTHGLSTSYDGITLLPEYAGTGNVVVFGYEE